MGNPFLGGSWSAGPYVSNSRYARKKCPSCGARPGQKCSRKGGWGRAVPHGPDPVEPLMGKSLAATLGLKPKKRAKKRWACHQPLPKPGAKRKSARR